jgi:hypothetical protein
MRPISEERIVWHCFFCFLAFRVYHHCRRFSFDCAPHVRPFPRFTDPTELGTHVHRQHRHLELEEDHCSNSNWRLGNQRYIPYSR